VWRDRTSEKILAAVNGESPSSLGERGLFQFAVAAISDGWEMISNYHPDAVQPRIGIIGLFSGSSKQWKPLANSAARYYAPTADSRPCDHFRLGHGNSD
jgi:hypothetical protein